MADAVDALVRAFAVLWRRWPVVLVCAALSVGLTVFGISLLQPRWRASATVVINMSGPQVLDKVQGVADENAGYAAYKQYYETQRAIIGSRAVAERALAGLGLSQDPVFLGIDHIRSEPERQARAAEIDPVERLRELISVKEVRDSRVVTISAEYPDAVVAAEIANAVAKAYVDYVTRSRSETGEQAKVDVETEKEQALEALTSAEDALYSFKDEHEITTISLDDRQSLITQNIITLSTRAKAAQAERIERQSTYEQAKKLHDAGNLATANLVPPATRVILDDLIADQLEAEQALEDAQRRYGEKHPEWIRADKQKRLLEARIEKQAKDILAAMKAEVAAARATEQRLQEALDTERDKALAVGKLEPRYRKLEREMRSAADAYDLVAKRDTEIGMTNRVERPPIEILDEATEPDAPVFPNKVLLLAAGLLFGLASGAVLALAVDFRDQRLRSTGDLERLLAPYGIPILGSLPNLPADPQLGSGNVRAQRRQRDLYTYMYPQSLMAERTRSLRTALSFTLSRERGGVLMVTSPGSGDGKSSTALNLAISFAQAGKRTVLVDADMRRPRLHQVFDLGAERESIGLSGVLTGEQQLDEALRGELSGAPERLSVLPCGAIPENPAELLDQPSVGRLIADLRERFDMIVIDSPPVLPVTDPVVLARRVDGVVLIARCQSTTRTEVQHALGLLRQGDTNLLGVIFNQVDTRRDGRGYGSRYYQYYYYQPREQRAES